MPHFLIFHGRLHGFVGRMLDEDYFAPRVAENRRLRLDDPMHGARSRYPEDMEPLSGSIRLVSGLLPFGYLDGMHERIIHVCVMSDPEVAFLRFAAELRGMPPGAVLRLAGVPREALPFDDPDALVPRLLAAPAIRRSRLGGMTRLCAGLPALEEAPADERQLRAAEANLARVNFLCGVEPRLDSFLDYLGGIFGWPPARPGLADDVPAPLVAPEALGPAARAALRAATDIDRRLYERRMDRNVAKVA
ncbi:hypothetical protein [Albimonas pacifica]|uniref:Sulfotransferase family protein n=1 Tax=Albimonas pacifica TaxID=1114924 RepID=A0A1I3MIS7_9RHOB|nr:hypothetical protein [Albimonas pacifica]SFI96899.1 hypothetical protein SAMN05216258_111125 [Albimonas pacifica]